MAEVLVIGGGGREQAIAQAIYASPEVERVLVSADVREGLEAFSSSREKPFVIVGPEAPLVAGLADDLRINGYPTLGASKACAQYEASKSRAAIMMRAAGVPHPDTRITYREGGNNMDARRHVIYNNPLSYVIKADGLAGGKGVVLPDTRAEAKEVVNRMIDGDYEGAGKDIINFSERHEGPEVSAMVLVGKGKDDFVVLPLAQDHKRLLEGDRGPNTGGMGAYSPLPEAIVSDEDYLQIQQIAHDSLAGIEAEGFAYQGAVLYIGLMKSRQLDNKMGVIEYNVRFGDPETQVIMPLLINASVDVYRLLRSAVEGNGIEQQGLDLAKIGGAAVTVCLASEGYPDSSVKGKTIYGLDDSYENVTIQKAAITTSAGHNVTNGGRVLYMTGVGETVDDAAASAYAAIGSDGEKGVFFQGMQYRKDIARQARTNYIA